MQGVYLKYVCHRDDEIRPGQKLYVSASGFRHHDEIRSGPCKNAKDNENGAQSATSEVVRASGLRCSDMLRYAATTSPFSLLPSRMAWL